MNDKNGYHIVKIVIPTKTPGYQEYRTAKLQRKKKQSHDLLMDERLIQVYFGEIIQNSLRSPL